MNYVFASSHLPEDNRPLDEEEEDVQPMLRAGGVRAFSHLRQRVPGEPAAPRPLGPPAPAHLPAWITEPPEAEHEPEAEADPDSHGDFAPPATAGSDTHGSIGPVSPRGAAPPAGRSLFLTPRPMPPGYAPQQQSGNQGRFSSYTRSSSPGTSYTGTPPEASARGAADGQRDDAWTDRPPPTRPDSSTATTGHGFDGRGTPEASDPEQGLGATGPSPQQRLQESQRAIAALKEQVRASNPPAQAAPPAPEKAKDTPPTFKVDPAEESREFMLTDPVTLKEYKSNRTFGDHVRSIMQEELDKSPTARKLLKQIIGKPGRPVTIKMTTSEKEAHPYIDRDGNFIVSINPGTVRIGTLSHEITHFLQGWALQHALKNAPRDKEGKTNPDDISKMARDLLNGVLPISREDERNGKIDNPQHYLENEAMRAANIAKAEISAARVKEKLDAMNASERASYLNDHAKLAALFWAAHSPREDTGHVGNLKGTFPIDTRYGESHFDHVLQTLGITEKELMDASPYKEARDKAAAARAEKSQPSGKAGGR